MAVVETNLSGLKKMVSEKRESFGPAGKWTYSPMFVPVATEGRPVLNVMRRQDFMDRSLGQWRTKIVARIGGIVLGVAALALLAYNVVLAAAAALAAGWVYGLYKRESFFFDYVNKRREIMEGT